LELFTKYSIVILLFVTLAQPSHLLPQSKGYVISGTVRDSSTGLPLENGIVFIEHSTLGTSLAKDGTFRLSHVPRNQCVIVISKVGYASRRISVAVPARDDSASYSFLLRPDPLALAEVEVSAAKPLPSATTRMLYPESDGSDAYCVFGAETSMPIGILFGDSLVYMYAFEQCVIDSEKYLHLWLLVSNHSRRIVQFDGPRGVELSMSSTNRTYGNISPTAADKLHSGGLKQTAEESPFLTKIRTSASASGNERQFYIDNIFRFDLAAGRPWLGWNAPDEVQGGISPVSLYDTYSSSHHEGLLKRYNISPGSSVSGSLLFPFPGMNWKSTTSTSESGLVYRYDISIRTSIGKSSIAFNAH